MSKFEVNGKEYESQELDFLFLLKLDEDNVNTADIYGMSAINSYFSFCSGLTKVQAAKEISAHVIANNGEFPKSLIDNYNTALEESGFFLALSQEGEQTEQTTETEESAESSAEKEEVATPKKRTKKA